MTSETARQARQFDTREKDASFAGEEPIAPKADAKVKKTKTDRAKDR